MSKNLKVHFLGIGGSGASAVAHIAQARGFEVTGCDEKPNNEFTSDFSSNQLLEGHSPEHLKNINILAVTPAIFSADPNNEELKAAKERGIEVLTWQEFMGKYLEKDEFVIAVCGTHGKSTTTAMVGQLLEDGGLDPTVELGAIVPKWGANYRIGKSGYFVTEADEFNDNFLASHPDVTIVTNIEMDHPEFFKDFEDYQDSFFQFFLQTKQTILGNLEDSVVADLLKDTMKETKVACFDFTKNELSFPLQIIGEYNVKNAQAVFQLGILLGIETEVIKQSLMNFQGIGKRMEKLGQFNGAQIYTDFAHHPTEVEVTLKAVREEFPEKKIWVIFQPHMFSRTKYLFDDFVKVFKDTTADGIWITDIYHAREEDKGEISSEQLVKAINNPQKVEYMPDFPEIEKSLRSYIGKDDVVIFMGAGVVEEIGRKLVNE